MEDDERKGFSAWLMINRLTHRETEVFGLIVRGHPRASIARMLSISPHTVAAHRRSIAQKLGEGSLARWVVLAVEAGVLEFRKAAKEEQQND